MHSTDESYTSGVEKTEDIVCHRGVRFAFRNRVLRCEARGNSVRSKRYERRVGSNQEEKVKFELFSRIITLGCVMLTLCYRVSETE